MFTQYLITSIVFISFIFVMCPQVWRRNEACKVDNKSFWYACTTQILFLNKAKK